mmetsp:Transcript_67494/g.180337  ORF Transcript_67494/g.180337 Transcript_67494/m.180337 type:complete len:330 (-) Transcript_67494:959-1948(-)
MASSTGPRPSCSRWISSMMTSRTSCVKGRASPLRVITSNFSGVMTMTCVSASCCLLSCTSPVNSLTEMPKDSSRFAKLITISATSAFMGARYTILNPSRSSVPSSRRCLPISCSIASRATLVLPAPVGAHTSMLSSCMSARSHTRDCTRFSDSVPSNAGCAHDGSSLILTSFSSASAALSPGTSTSSYPLRDTRCEPTGSSHRLFAMVWPPATKESPSRSSSCRGASCGPESTAMGWAPPASAASDPAMPFSRSPRISLRRRFSMSRLRSPSVLWEKVRASRMLRPSAVLRISSWIAALSSSFCACPSCVQKTMAWRFLSRALMKSNLS